MVFIPFDNFSNGKSIECKRMDVLLFNKEELRWSIIPLDKELLKPYHSKDSEIKVIDASQNHRTKQLFDRISQRDDFDFAAIIAD